jgi:hypothetical protein
VRLLLQRGARGDRADKHGILPVMLARDAQHTECEVLLYNWQLERERDLIERDEALDLVRTVSRDERRPSASTLDESSLLSSSTSGRKRLAVKRSVDKLLGKMSPATPCFSPDPATSPFGEYTFYPPAEESNEDIAGDRRPSLPYIMESPPPATRSRRPRSAGNGSEPPSTSLPQQQQPQPSPVSMRHRLSSKLSLLSMLRKSGEDGSPPSSPPDAYPSPNDPNGSTPFTASALSPRERLLSEASSTGLARPPQFPTAVEMHNALSRARSGSGASSDGVGSPSAPRPGILRGHMRSSSSGAGQQRLRFDPTSTNPSVASLVPRATPNAASPRSRALSLRGLSPGRGGGMLRGSGSATSLKSIDERRRSDAIVDDDEDDEDEYGQPIEAVGEEQQLHSQLCRLRGPSITSSTSSLSPIISPDNNAANATESASEFPFSIRQPPPTAEDDPRRLGVPPRPGIVADARDRGGSVSSMSTNGSTGLMTPATAARLPLPMPLAAILQQPEPPHVSSSFADHRALRSPSRTPLEIDLSEISSHAQAEALVQRAQKSLLDMALGEGELLAHGPGGSGGAGAAGATPLSAKLAAYGESLALERKLKQQEEERRAALASPVNAASTSPSVSSPAVSQKLYGTLEQRPVADRRRPSGKVPIGARARKMRRPHTADAETRQWDGGKFLFFCISFVVRLRDVHPPFVSAVTAAAISRASSDEPGRLRRVNLADSDSDSDPEPSPHIAPIQIVETSATPLQTPIKTSMLHDHFASDIEETPVPPRTKPAAPSPMVLPPSSSVALGGDSTDADTTEDEEFGSVPLTRTYTAPLQSTSLQRRDGRASANKLARMGFANAAPPVGVGAGGSAPRIASVGSTGTPKRGFGGIKSFVQSLKTK